MGEEERGQGEWREASVDWESKRGDVETVLGEGEKEREEKERDGIWTKRVKIGCLNL